MMTKLLCKILKNVIYIYYIKIHMLYIKIHMLYIILTEKEMAIHSSILPWRIPRTEESGGLQFMGSQKSDTT